MVPSRAMVRRAGVGVEPQRRAADVEHRLVVERQTARPYRSSACARRAYRRCPLGVCTASQASPCTATSSMLSVRTNSPDLRER